MNSDVILGEAMGLFRQAMHTIKICRLSMEKARMEGLAQNLYWLARQVWWDAR